MVNSKKEKIKKTAALTYLAVVLLLLYLPLVWIFLFSFTASSTLGSFDGFTLEVFGNLFTGDYSEEIASALCLTRLTAENLETAWDEQFEDVFYVPWSASVAEVFDRLQQIDRKVAVVVNEFGETIGIITIDDIIATLFMRGHGRSRELLNRRELKLIEKNCWQLTGLTSLRMLRRRFNVSFRQYASLTVGGLLREILERLPRTGDVCRVETLQFRVIDSEDDDDLVIYLQICHK